MAARERKKPAKRAAKKRTTSKISDAQKAAVERRLERTDSLRGMAAASRSKNLQKDPNNPKIGASSGTPNKGVDKTGVIGNPVRAGEIAAANGTQGGQGNQSLSQAANKIAGLATNLREVKARAAATPQQPLANPDLYGTVTAKDRVAKLNELMSAQAEQKARSLKSKGEAVYMGAQRNNAKIRNRGPERFDESGKDYETTAVGEAYLSKSELLSWLSDPDKLDQIKAGAEAAGLKVQTVDDVMKLWTSVVNQAADSYSLAGKKVTPWALLKLRGRYSVDGKMPDRVTTTTNIDEMEPEQARLMFEQTAMQALGRSPTKSEVDDFIAKAQTIAKSNPTVTKTTQKIGFDGNVTDTTNVTTGGGADAKAQVAAMDQARQSEDYASYQAAGNYFPMLFEALRSPV